MRAPETPKELEHRPVPLAADPGASMNGFCLAEGCRMAHAKPRELQVDNSDSDSLSWREHP